MVEDLYLWWNTSPLGLAVTFTVFIFTMILVGVYARESERVERSAKEIENE